MTPTKYEFYKAIAQDYKAQLLIKKYRAVVHLENKNDESFWRKLLQLACPQEKFLFIPATRTQSGTQGTGCGQCLLFRDFLDDKFVIGIDSDLRYLKQESGINATHYILQTYTYSFENHLCFAERLKDLPAKVCGLSNSLFDFEAFLVAYSEEIYPLLLFFLYDSKQPNSIYSIDEFSRVISIPDIPEKLKKNGKCIIKEIQTRVSIEIAKLKRIHTSYNEDYEAKQYTMLGLKKDNAYLYVRGHELYKLIVRVGQALCKELKLQEKNRLEEINKLTEITTLYASQNTFEKECKMAELHFSYPEIIKCIDDIHSIFKT